VESINLIIQTVAISVNNTFVGTFFAGGLIAFLGLRIYRKQKELDIDYSRKQHQQELAKALLTHITIALKDFDGQISVHNGSNPSAKIIFERVKQLSPTYITNETSMRFSTHTSSITKSWNELSIPLALNTGNDVEFQTLVKTIPLLTFLFSTAASLENLPLDILTDIKSQLNEYSDQVIPLLTGIAS
jgi:hypothetical protein